MKKALQVIILNIFILIFVATPLAAAFTSLIQVVESGGNSYDMVASNVTLNIDYMADNGYFGSTTGLDTRVQEGTSAIPHMLVEDRILFANDLNAYQSKNYNFTTDNSLLSSFNIITGYGGSVNITDDSDIELGDNFTWGASGYIDTDNGTDKYLIEKPYAFEAFVSDTVAGNITATITNVPIVETRATGQAGVDTTSHVITMPAGIVAGDLLLVAFSTDGSTVSSNDSTLWTKLNEDNTAGSVTGAIWYKVATGTDSLTLTTNNSERSTHVSLRISGAGTPTTTGIDGASGNADPPNHNPGVTQNLWIATSAFNGNINATVAPANYTDLTGITDGNSNGAGTSTAERTLEATSENPGVFTNATTSWVAHTISVPKTTTSVSATGVSSGERGIEVTTDNNSLLFGIGVDNTNATFPITDNLTFNSPFWHTELNAAIFTSKDENETSCTVTGAVWSSTSGYTFEGAEYIDISGTAATIQDYTVGTIVMWVRMTSNTVGTFFGASDLTDADSRFLLYYNPTSTGVWGFCSEAGTIFYMKQFVGATMALDTWYHIALVHNGTVPSLYFDTVSKGIDGGGSDYTKFFSGVNNIDNVEIGVCNTSGGRDLYLNANVGEVRIYNDVLSASEVAQDRLRTQWKYDSSDEYFHYNLLRGSVPDNANNYVMLQNNVMPYTDNITMTIGGTQQLWYEPNDIIALSGINGVLPDRQGADNDGTIIFGSNPSGVAVTIGALISDYSATATDPTETPSFVPAGTTPQTTSTAVKEAALVAHPLYEWVSSWEGVTSVGVLFQFQFIYLAGALWAFAGTFTWLRNMFLSGGLFVGVIGMGVMQSVFDWWVLLLVVPLWLGLTIMENRRTA